MSEQTGAEAGDSLFDHYPLGAAYDEMLAEPGSPRTAYKPVFHTLRAMTGHTLKERADTLARSYLDQGVTFDYAGEERPFPLDAVPRVISAHEWQVIESGVVQRVTALESFLDDIYSREGEIPRAVHEGVIPWRLIASSTPIIRARRACSKYAELKTPGVSTTTVGSLAPSGAAARSAPSSIRG